MSLTPTADSVSIRILQHVTAVAGHLSNAATHLNATTLNLLALRNDALSAWLNARGPESVAALFAAHQRCGDVINEAQVLAVQQLHESGMATRPVPVDVRSFMDRLNELGRTLTAGPEGLTVADLPPPEPVAPPGDDPLPPAEPLPQTEPSA